MVLVADLTAAVMLRRAAAAKAQLPRYQKILRARENLQQSVTLYHPPKMIRRLALRRISVCE